MKLCIKIVFIYLDKLYFLRYMGNKISNPRVNWLHNKSYESVYKYAWIKHNIHVCAKYLSIMI